MINEVASYEIVLFSYENIDDKHIWELTTYMQQRHATHGFSHSKKCTYYEEIYIFRMQYI